jgi:hypothetical protein
LQQDQEDEKNIVIEKTITNNIDVDTKIEVLLN